MQREAIVIEGNKITIMMLFDAEDMPNMETSSNSDVKTDIDEIANDAINFAFSQMRSEDAVDPNENAETTAEKMVKESEDQPDGAVVDTLDNKSLATAENLANEQNRLVDLGSDYRVLGDNPRMLTGLLEIDMSSLIYDENNEPRLNVWSSDGTNVFMNNPELKENVRSNIFINGSEAFYQITSEGNVSLVFPMEKNGQTSYKTLGMSVGSDSTGNDIRVISDCNYNSQTNAVEIGGINYNTDFTAVRTVSLDMTSIGTSALTQTTSNIQYMDNDALMSLDTGMNVGRESVHFQITTGDTGGMVFTYGDNALVMVESKRGEILLPASYSEASDGRIEIGEIKLSQDNKSVDVVSFSNEGLDATVKAYETTELFDPKPILPQFNLALAGKEITTGTLNGKFEEGLVLNLDFSKTVELQANDGTVVKRVVLARATADNSIGVLNGQEIKVIYGDADTGAVLLQFDGVQNVTIPGSGDVPTGKATHTVSKYDVISQSGNSLVADGLIEYQVSKVNNAGQLEMTPLLFNEGAQITIADGFNTGLLIDKSEIIIKDKVLVAGDTAIIGIESISVSHAGKIRHDVDFITQNVRVSETETVQLDREVRFNVSLKNSVQKDENQQPILRKAGLLTRDPRATERKKYFLRKARKKGQFSKR